MIQFAISEVFKVRKYNIST